MSYERRKNNPGKRERAARKRHRRTRASDNTMTGWLKLGRKKMSGWATRLAVADRRKPCQSERVMVRPLIRLTPSFDD